MRSFGTALKDYLSSGFTPARAMKAAWHDVKAGGAARPPRRKQIKTYPVKMKGKTVRVTNPRTARFCPETLQPASRFDRRSFRTIVARGHRVTVACPKRTYSAHGAGRCRHPMEAQRILHPISEGHCPYGGRHRRNPPRGRAKLSTFYDRLVDIRAIKGRRARHLAGRYKHRFTSRARARGVDRSGWRRMRRGEVVLTGRRPIYARLRA